MKVGVLALQGSVAEHLKLITSVNKKIDAVPVRTVDELACVDGLIIPGGESTTLRKLIDEFDLFTPIKVRVEAGMPVWGTCAGLILLANKIEGERPYFSLLDVDVVRNAYGRQINSFVAEGDFADMYINMVFIRAPKITRVGGDVEVLSTHEDVPVAVRQGHILATAFHPEMVSRDNRVHKYFINMIESKE
ncbi:MAG: pyridoxal 5'-phosphate synthase glutaminase subunit PdxT [Clostridiales bacterium]|nr:pyridoxal 5'-phosphate synthase glutaminase subunit PdxT [Clostridiales bacterium]